MMKLLFQIAFSFNSNNKELLTFTFLDIYATLQYLILSLVPRTTFPKCLEAIFY